VKRSVMTGSREVCKGEGGARDMNGIDRRPKGDHFALVGHHGFREAALCRPDR